MGALPFVQTRCGGKAGICERSILGPGITIMMNPLPQPSFRRATAADSATIAALTRAAYAHYVPRLGREPQPMTTDYDQILAAHPVWLLCLADEPIGVLVLMHEPEA